MPSMANRIREVRARADRRAVDATAAAQAAGPLEEELHPQPVLRRQLPVAPGARPGAALLRPGTVHHCGAADGVSSSGLATDARCVRADTPLLAWHHLQRLHLGVRVSQREPRVLTVDLSACHEPLDRSGVLDAAPVFTTHDP